MSARRPSATDAVARAFARIDQVDRPELWIHLAEPHDAHAAARAIDARVAQGEHLPLAGLTVAVKDNIDVAGMPSTAGAPVPLRRPDLSAPAVAALEEAGAVVIGKTTLDQFATGLVGTRTPYGIPSAAHDASLVSGGSSSGSAVAVALGIVDLGIGTDTAGSGRVPAALNGIVGVKPTLGLLSAHGVFPASPSYDTASIFARSLALASAAMDVASGRGAARPWPAEFALTARLRRVGRVSDAVLGRCDARWAEAYRASVGALEDAGIETVEIDVEPLLATARLLYEGALLAERAAAFGEALDQLGERADPTVARIVAPAAGFRAVDLVRDQQALVVARAEAGRLWGAVDAIVVPSVPEHPTIAAVEADPVGVNARLGTFTNFVNLLDMSALAVPAPPAAHAPAGVTLIGPAFADHVLADLASRAGLADAVPVDHRWGAPSVDVVVFGAHRSRQPLNHQLTDRGARLLGRVRTAEAYAMARLDTVPPKPGVWRTPEGGRGIVGERWALPPAAFAAFAVDLVWPMAIGSIELDTGERVLGFTCEPGALDIADAVGATDDWLELVAP
ncbi:allophanate hydrolase [Demequina silvatica]|uniref:allophanate hydrolase n=1 Tax=Demequina silvatica TaxID=1638988 RepID=UPI0007842878|nr:allophanate hydrolase [Demequina silvatica]